LMYSLVQLTIAIRAKAINPKNIFLNFIVDIFNLLVK
jgi:hypothetical protein